MHKGFFPYTKLLCFKEKFMIHRIFKQLILATLLFAFSNASFANNNASQSIAFSASSSESELTISCKPLNDAVAKDASWVEKCNQAALEFLIAQQEQGVQLEKQVPEKPFGMAAEFMANTLKSNPSNFEAVSINRAFALISNKT
ncbi:hypothetical protein [Alteromonas gracilis]